MSERITIETIERKKVTMDRSDLRLNKTSDGFWAIELCAGGEVYEIEEHTFDRLNATNSNNRG